VAAATPSQPWTAPEGRSDRDWTHDALPVGSHATRRTLGRPISIPLGCHQSSSPPQRRGEPSCPGGTTACIAHSFSVLSSSPAATSGSRHQTMNGGAHQVFNACSQRPRMCSRFHRLQILINCQPLKLLHHSIQLASIFLVRWPNRTASHQSSCTTRSIWLSFSYASNQQYKMCS
jgi:hypothetical protein